MNFQKNNNNNSSQRSSQRGFFKTIIIVVIVIIILMYFGKDIKEFLESDEFKDIVKKIIKIISYLWNNYIKAPIYLLWDKVVVGILWEMILKPALEALDKISQK